MKRKMQDGYVVMRRTSYEKLIKELKEVKKENKQLKDKIKIPRE